MRCLGSPGTFSIFCRSRAMCVSTVRVNAELFGPERLIDKEKGEFSIWITDDARRIPVRGRVKTDYGTFDIKLKRFITSTPAVK